LKKRFFGSSLFNFYPFLVSFTNQNGQLLSLKISNKSFRISRITKKDVDFFAYQVESTFLNSYIVMNFGITDTVYPLCQSLIKKISLLTHATAKIAKPRKMTFR
jgi:hypothetical protein